MTTPMSDEQLAEIRQRLAATTAGPWTARDLYVIAPDDVHIADFEWLANTDEEWAEFKANTVFAAAARQDVPALLAEVERLRAELEDARAELGRRVAPVEMLALKRQRDEAQAEVKQWRATFGETALRDSLARLARTEAERDAAREQVKRVRDEKLLRQAIADPGAYVARRWDSGVPGKGHPETVASWAARAIVAALDGTGMT
ncbi:hypothetical protein [Actinomadura luteofluorescens]|uniref:hypothetical protein n=1 Tax=Actinomadura luteofluorescens TaxID=46163 RepID=UPI003D8A47C6